MRHLVPIALLLAGCHVGYDFVPQDDTLTLDLTSPQYGAFLGDEPILVEGRVYPEGATVRVEGEEVDASDHGAFRVPLEVGGPYRIVDVEADYEGQHLRERVPVFAGHDPIDTWPEGITGRILPAGLDALGAQLGAVLDQTIEPSGMIEIVSVKEKVSIGKVTQGNGIAAGMTVVWSPAAPGGPRF